MPLLLAFGMERIVKWAALELILVATLLVLFIAVIALMTGTLALIMLVIFTAVMFVTPYFMNRSQLQRTRKPH